MNIKGLSYFNVFGILIFFICSSFTPVHSKNQKFRWGKHPYFWYIDTNSDISIFIRNTKEIAYFCIFYYQKSLEFLKTFQNKS